MSPLRTDDTGNRHILSNWTIEACNDMGDPSGDYPDARIWTLPAGVNMPQFQLAMRGVQYEGELYEGARLSLEEVRMDRFGKNFMSVLDADGSLTGRGVRTIIGPTRGAKFWMLEDVEAHAAARCENRSDWDYAMWACDAGDRRIASMEFEHASSALSFEERVGTINHWGYAPDRGAEIGGDTAIIGPYHHDALGGWFVSLDKGAPVRLHMSRIQVAKDSTLMLAVAYPPGTNFTVQAAVSRWCNTGSGHLCEHTLTDAGSVAAVRHGAGDTYHFDGTYLYLKVVSMARQSTGPYYLGTTETGWAELADGDTFTRAGISIYDRGNSRYSLTVTADCTPSSADADYCSEAVAASAPPVVCPDGQVQVGIDMCASACGGDSDSDGTLDCNDGCPADGDKTEPGVCGCGVADTDTDGDGTPDCSDGCPLDSAATQAGSCADCGNSVVRDAYWLDGAVWDEACSVELHGACPPADPSRQLSYVRDDGTAVVLTRRLVDQQRNMQRRISRCAAPAA